MKNFYFIILFTTQFINVLSSQEIVEKNINALLQSSEWKLAHEQHTSTEYIYEWIPTDQTLSDYNEMVTFYRINNFSHNNRPKSLQEFLKKLREQIIFSYPGSRVTFNVIKESKDEIIYEWQLLDQYQDISPQHEITRINLIADRYFQHLNYTKKTPKIDPINRELWITRLNSVILTNSEELSPSDSLIDNY